MNWPLKQKHDAFKCHFLAFHLLSWSHFSHLWSCFFAIFAMCAIFQLRTASHYAIILYLLPVFSSSFLSYIASSVLLSPNAASSLAESWYLTSAPPDKESTHAVILRGRSTKYRLASNPKNTELIIQGENTEEEHLSLETVKHVENVSRKLEVATHWNNDLYCRCSLHLYLFLCGLTVCH